MKRSDVVALISAVGLVVLTACGGGNAQSVAVSDNLADLTAAAQSEGALTWYSGSPPETAATVAEAFEAEYGIKVTVVRLTSAQIAQRFVAESKAGDVQADVLTTVDEAFFRDMRSQGLTKALTDGQFGEVPEEYRLDDAAVQFLAGPISVPYNTEAVRGFTIDSWDDLLNPALRGKIVLADPRGSRAWAQLWTVILNDPNLGEDYIRSFAQQNFSLVDSGTVGFEMLSAGEATAVVAGVVNSTQPLIDAGAP
ncbi:MAG: extracellular solute-binding protein, partial [Rhodococcus fascians]